MIRRVIDFLFLLSLVVCNTVHLAADERPNILWLTTEDIGPELPCYGDQTARTPHLDDFAKRSLTYNIAWSNYPVCAPARTTIITGMYAAANGAGNMRSNVHLSPEIRMFPILLRQAGYYCTNKSKTDYNHPFNKDVVWDACSGKAHWQNRPAGKPFFAVINHTGTHESKIRKRPHQAVIDPATVKLRPYWPDRPEVRQDWAQYYDNIQAMDSWFGSQLQELEAAGLADDTIVVFFGDHGSGMPRHKRFAGDSGQRVPMLVHVPQKFRQLAPEDYAAGRRTQELISFVDLAPTMLSLAGVEPPDWMQGRSVMGKFRNPPPKFLFGFRDRMDERPDFSRAVRDQKFIYVRNFMPHLPAGQHVNYQMQTPTTAVWNRMFRDGDLNEVQSHFWKPHPPEELYDLAADPFETRNLAGEARYQDDLIRFRNALRENTMRIRDLGFLPESAINEIVDPEISLRKQFALRPGVYPVEAIFDLANLAANHDAAALPELAVAAADELTEMRYWAAIGFLNRPDIALTRQRDTVNRLLQDPSPAVQVVAAELVAIHGNQDDRRSGREVLLRNADLTRSDFFTALAALNALDRCEELSDSVKARIARLPTKSPGISRGGDYVQRMVIKLTGGQ